MNSPDDLGVKRRLRHLDELQAKARAANTRLLAVQKAGQDCAISAPLFERVALPSLQEGQRVPALRFGDPRVMALAGALCVLVHTVVGFTNRSLCAQVSSLLGGPYTSTQTTYDLRRLRMKRLIRRVEGQNRYVLTPDGVRVAAFYTKLHRRPPRTPPRSRQTTRTHRTAPRSARCRQRLHHPSPHPTRGLKTCLTSQQQQNQGALPEPPSFLLGVRLCRDRAAC